MSPFKKLTFCFFCSLFLPGLPVAADSGSTLSGLTAKEMQQMRADQTARRQERNRREWLEAMKIDSVGWAKTLANKNPNVPIGQMQAERQARKTAAVLNFCEGSHFAAFAEVDSLREMTAADKKNCKDRLRSQNPLMP